MYTSASPRYKEPYRYTRVLDPQSLRNPGAGRRGYLTGRPARVPHCQLAAAALWRQRAESTRAGRARCTRCSLRSSVQGLGRRPSPDTGTVICVHICSAANLKTNVKLNTHTITPRYFSSPLPLRPVGVWENGHAPDASTTRETRDLPPRAAHTRVFMHDRPGQFPNWMHGDALQPHPRGSHARNH